MSSFTTAIVIFFSLVPIFVPDSWFRALPSFINASLLAIHPAGYVKLHSIQSLEDVAGYDDLLKSYLETGDSTLRYCAMVGLVNRDLDKNFFAAEYAAKSNEAWLRNYTALFVSKYNTDRSRQLLRQLLNDPDLNVKAVAAKALKEAKE